MELKIKLVNMCSDIYTLLNKQFVCLLIYCYLLTSIKATFILKRKVEYCKTTCTITNYKQQKWFSILEKFLTAHQPKFHVSVLA